jgi:hypothetical protein
MVMALAERGVAQSKTSRGSRVEPKTGTGGGTALDGVRIRKLEGIGRKSLVRTPEFRHNLSPSTKRAGDWSEIKLTYDSSAEWIDEVTIQLFALSESKIKNKLVYTLYRKTVRNMDVERGEGHMVTVYLSPNAVKRYGAPIAVAAEMSVGGKPVSVMQESDKSVKLPEEWWKSEKITQSEGVTIRDDYLLTREQSPFGLVAIDDYEGSK